MLTLYRRHTRACSAHRKQHDRAWRKCRCTIHVEGTLGEEQLRRSLKTRDWEQASRRVMEAEGRGAWEIARVNAQTVSSAIAAFLADAESRKGRGLSRPTLSKYRTLFDRCQTFCHERGLTAIADLTPEHLRAFRESWPTGPRATGNNIARLKAFFKFCLEAEWIQKNPAIAMRPPKHIRDTQKLPFPEAEMESIRTAARKLALSSELETLILLMRQSGLRISDAAMLKADRLDGDELRLHTQKTGSWVCIPLEPELLERLRTTEVKPGGYLFVTGSTRMETVTDLWRRKIRRVFASAGIAHGTVHRFRHTFAVDLLTKGVDIKTVSLLLGHSSVTITERFYAAWISSRQQKLSEQVRRTWDEAA
jgi:integrase/recombinase XerD